MPTFDTFLTTPAGSAATAPENDQTMLVEQLSGLPPVALKTASSPNTGAYIRGLVKRNQLPESTAPQLAQLILRVMIGERQLAQLPGLLSAQFKIANDKANSIAKEIEKEIFAPIALELNQYFAKKRQRSGAGKSMAEKLQPDTSPAAKSGPTPIVKRGAPLKPQNVLNLRDSRKPPSPPPIPKK